jgi:hypothetical protein
MKQHSEACDVIDGLLSGHLIPTIRYFVCALSDLLGIIKSENLLIY